MFSPKVDQQGCGRPALDGQVGQEGAESQMVSPRGTGRWKTRIDRWFPVDGPRRATAIACDET